MIELAEHQLIWMYLECEEITLEYNLVQHVVRVVFDHIPKQGWLVDPNIDGLLDEVT